MWTCPECKNQNIDDTKICLSCGKGRICQECLNPTSGDICEHCSTPYKKTVWLTEAEYEKLKPQKTKDKKGEKQTSENTKKQKKQEKAVPAAASVKVDTDNAPAAGEVDNVNSTKTEDSAPVVQPGEKEAVGADVLNVSPSGIDTPKEKVLKKPEGVKASSSKAGKITAIVAALLIVAVACAYAGYNYIYLPHMERSKNIITEVFDPVESSGEEAEDDELLSDAQALSDALLASDAMAISDAVISSDAHTDSAAALPVTEVPPQSGEAGNAQPQQNVVSQQQAAQVQPVTPQATNPTVAADATASKQEVQVDPNEAAYKTAKSNLKNKKYFKAYTGFKKLGSYADSRQQLGNVAYEVAKYFSAGHDHSAVSRLNGTVSACGSNDYGKSDINKWVNITGISVNGNHSVGVRKDGTMIASGSNEFGQCEVAVFKKIKEVSAGMHHTLALTKSGTAVAVGDNRSGQCNVYLKNWSNLKSVSAGGYHSVALKKDGTVLAVGNNEYGQCNVSDWKDIVQISAGAWYTLGLKKDGTVLFAGLNDQGQAAVSSWKNVVYVSAGMWHCLGLKADGKVLAAGNNDHGQCNVSSWKNIVCIDAGGYAYSLGINSAGKVLAAGNNSMGQTLATKFAVVAQ